MYCDSESDAEYGPNGWPNSDEWPPERLLQREERKARYKASVMVRELHVKLPDYDREVFVQSKVLLRAFTARPPFDLDLKEDWRRWRFFRFFLEIQGFHKGQLDLSARSIERYNKLKRTWLAFRQDFLVLMWKAGPSSRLASAPNSRRTHWRKFRNRWDITSTISSAQVISCVARTLEVLAANVAPIFQKLHLVNLPPEILSIIYESSDMDGARALSATCQHMREIGLTSIFLTRRLFVEYPYVIMQSMGEITGPELDAQLVHGLSTSVSSCLGGYHFLLTRPDICSRITYLEVGVGWPSWVLGMIEDQSTPLIDDLHEHLLVLLGNLRLTRLHAAGLQFDTCLAARFAEQPFLTVCELNNCSTTPGLQEHLQRLPHMTLRSPLQSLTTRVDDRRGMWPLLAFCPGLRLLHAYSFSSRDIARDFSPPEDISHVTAALGNLERMCLDGLRTAIGYVHWFQETAAQGPMRLTHLKLVFDLHMPDHWMIDILRAAHAANAPLEVLVLDGIMPASVALVQTIAELFPSLVALTLIRRSGIRPDHRHERKRSQWPDPLHEYAVHFRNLTRLRHFAANFYLDYEALSPVVLDHLINRMAPRRRNEEEFDDKSALERPEDLARPFAAYCPSLETFDVEGCCGRVWAYVTISRSPSGAIVLEPTPRMWESPGGRAPEEMWDPDTSRPWTLPPHIENEQRHYARRPESYIFW